MQIPREAGTLLVTVRGKRSGAILGGVMLVIIAAMPLFDRTLWPVSVAIFGMVALVGGFAFGVKRLFGRRLIAVGELGLVVGQRSGVVVIPWRAIKSVTRETGGSGMEAISKAMSAHYWISWGGAGVGFVPHDLRGDTGDGILSALRMFGKQEISA